MDTFEKEMFFQKQCLDIGCHDGSLTLQIAIKFFPETITGIDIDYRLINKAITNMRFFEKTHSINKPKEQNSNQLPDLTTDQIAELQKDNQIQALLAKLQTFPKSFTQTFGTGSLFLNKTLDKTIKEISENKQIEPEKRNSFPDNVQFNLANYLNYPLKKLHYDTILCLSLTKYIHLNFGDYGIQLLFEKISKELKIGGYLIFEPQSWKSYKKKLKLCETFKATMKKMKIRPDSFTDILEKKGIKLLKELESKKGHSEYGKRKLYLYQKMNDS